MPSFGTWRAPFPFRFGGGGHRRASELFESIRANTGSAFSHDPDAVNVLEDQCYARALCIADRAIERYRSQADPTRLADMLERWEDIFGIVPATDASLLERRNAVASRLQGEFLAGAALLSEIVAEAFYPWATQLSFTPLGSAVMFWPAGTQILPTRFFTSTVAHFAVLYYRPAGASDDDATVRKDAANEALNAYAPAWATFCMSEVPLYGPTASLPGFYLDVLNLEVSALSA